MARKNKQRSRPRHQSKLPDKLKTLPAEFKEVLEAIPMNKREEVAERLLTVVSQKLFIGLIPSPEMLKEYDEVYPGLAKSIVKTAHSETEHRQKIESLLAPADVSRIKRGQNYGFILALIGIGASVIMAYLGHDNFAMVLGGTTVVSLVTVFVVGKAMKTK